MTQESRTEENRKTADQGFTAQEGQRLRCGLRTVNRPLRKKDAMALVTGKPVFLDDVTRGDYLVVKVLRSPHANAMIE